MKKLSIITATILLVFTMSYNMLDAAPNQTEKKNSKEIAQYVALSKAIVKTDEVSLEEAVVKVVEKKLKTAKTLEDKVETISELVSMTIATVVDYSRGEIIDAIEAMSKTIMESTQDEDEQIKFARAIISAVYVITTDKAGNVNQVILDAAEAEIPRFILEFTEDVVDAPVSVIGIYQTQYVKEIYDEIRKIVFNYERPVDGLLIITTTTTTTTTTMPSGLRPSRRPQVKPVPPVTPTTKPSPTPVGRR